MKLKPTPPQGLIGRLLWVVLGVGLLFSALAGGGENTLLGFVPPINGEAMGADLFVALLAALAIWLIYHGVRPSKKAPNSN